jgi:quercetin dioxygenase-like cupin family protein
MTALGDQPFVQPSAVTAPGYGIEAHSAFPIRPGVTDHEATASRCLHLVGSMWAQRNTGDMDMLNQIRGAFMPRQGLCAVALLTGAVLAVPANARECPADKVRPGVRTQGQTQAKGVTDTVLASVDLSKEKVNLADHQLRTRRLVIQPGGIVPWHSHEDRPALIYIVSGVIEEHASNCSVPLVHKAGEVSVEKSGVHHWWKNTGKVPVVLLSSDVFHNTPNADPHMM